MDGKYLCRLVIMEKEAEPLMPENYPQRNMIQKELGVGSGCGMPDDPLAVDDIIVHTENLRAKPSPPITASELKQSIL